MLPLRRPEWLKKKIDFDKNRTTSRILNKIGVHTVCNEAKCPNISECFKKSHATFLILGKYCTRACRFCNVEKKKPQKLDPNEPAKVAKAVSRLNLSHIVITSVTRDDLIDGGASVFAKTVSEIKKLKENKRYKVASIELLIPDLQGNTNSLIPIIESLPDIIGHNIETVPRLYFLRPKSDYARSLKILKSIKKFSKRIYTKSALILGLGEKKEEVIEAMQDLIKADCDFLALGQYLRPSLKATEVIEYIQPEMFELYKKIGLDMGFKHIEAAPYVRSSFNAANYF